ncbi:ABC transporter substrate-binding protein [Candidatus Halobonum tyrrellensis G22]|uniref:ABC transporter substrate-binding protein n=1 Tax=Candidatus Halobonum tyrrellensis G22 TaxID=1324957 RepID=V4HHC5_9EURY|nr:ABC transporter substrate-binding protein [Candidatus Halobonum tyrrellensis G22]
MTALAGCSGGDGTNEAGAGGTTASDEETSDSGAGSTTGGSGELGEPLPSYLYLNNPASYNAPRHDAINLIGSRLGDVGFDMSVEVFEWGALYDKVRQQRDFDFTTWHHGLGVDPGQLMYEFFHSSGLEGGAGNFTGYSTEEMDEVLSEQMQTTDTGERVDLLHQFENMIVEAAPTNAIVWMPQLMAYNSDQVSNWTQHPASFNYYYNMTNIEVDNPSNELRGSWSESLGSLNVVGGAAQTKLEVQWDVLYDKLVRFDSDLQPDPEISLASEWTRPDRTTMEYTLKDHTWHDGEDLTAEDAAFTFNYLKEHNAPLYAVQTEMYEDAEAVDSRTVRVNFTEENAPGPVHTLFSFQVPIIPKHVWESRDSPLDLQVTEPVGSGPLKFDYWDQGSELSLVKYDDHFNPVNFDRRIWRIIPESSTTWELLLNGDLNYLPFSRIGKQLNDNREESQIGVASAPGTSWWHMSMNTRRDGLADQAVRQAAVHAIPKTAIVEQLLYDFPEPGSNLVTPAFGDYYTDEVPEYDEGVEAAKRRLTEAGYGFGEDGLVHFPAE